MTQKVSKSSIRLSLFKFRRLVLALVFLFAAQGMWGETYFWVGADGNWNDSDHWSTTNGGTGGAGVPGTADTVYITNGSIISFTGNVTVTNLIIATGTNPAATFRLNEHELKVNETFNLGTEDTPPIPRTKGSLIISSTPGSANVTIATFDSGNFSDNYLYFDNIQCTVTTTFWPNSGYGHFFTIDGTSNSTFTHPTGDTTYGASVVTFGEEIIPEEIITTTDVSVSTKGNPGPGQQVTVTINSTNSVYYKATITGSENYKIKVDGGTETDLDGNATEITSGTHTLTLTFPASIAQNNGLVFSIYNDSGASNLFRTLISYTQTLNETIWTGADSTDNTAWGVAANWSNGVPTDGMKVTIPQITGDIYPIITTATVTNLTLTINSGASLTVDTGGTLNTKSIRNNGTLAVSGGTVNSTTITNNEAIILTSGTITSTTFTNNKTITITDGTITSTQKISSSASKIIYNKAGTQNLIWGNNYQNLEIATGTSVTFDSATTISGKAANNGTITIGTNSFSVGSVENGDSSTIIYNGVTSPVWGNEYQNLTITAGTSISLGAATIAGTVTNNGTLTITSNLFNAGSTDNGTETSAIIYVGVTTPEDVWGTSYKNLTISSGNVSFANAVTIANDFTNAGIVTFNNAATITGTVTNDGTLNIKNSISADHFLGTGTINLNGGTTSITATTTDTDITSTQNAIVASNADATITGQFNVSSFTAESNMGGKSITLNDAIINASTISLHGSTTTSRLSLIGSGTNHKFTSSTSSVSAEYLSIDSNIILENYTDEISNSIPTADNSNQNNWITVLNNGWNIRNKSAFVYTWIGNTDDWNTATNWDTGYVPGADSKIIIPSGCASYPVLTNGTYNGGTLTLSDKDSTGITVTTPDSTITLGSKNLVLSGKDKDNPITPATTILTNYGTIIYTNDGRITHSTNPINDNNVGKVQYASGNTGTVTILTSSIEYYDLEVIGTDWKFNGDYKIKNKLTINNSATELVDACAVTSVSTIQAGSFDFQGLVNFKENLTLAPYDSTSEFTIPSNLAEKVNTSEGKCMYLGTGDNPGNIKFDDTQDFSYDLYLNSSATITSGKEIRLQKSITATDDIDGEGTLTFTGADEQDFITNGKTFAKIKEDKSNNKTLTVTGSCNITDLSVPSGNITFANLVTIKTSSFNTTNTVSFQNGANFLYVDNESNTNYCDLVHTAGPTNIKGTLTAADVTLSKTELKGNTTIEAYGDVVFENDSPTDPTVYAKVFGENELTITTHGDGKSTTFNGEVGTEENKKLQSLKVTGITNINCDYINTTGNQIYEGEVILKKSTTLNAKTSGETPENKEILFKQNVTGNTSANTTLVVNGDVKIESESSPVIILTNGNQTYNGTVTFNKSATFTASTVTFKKDVTGSATDAVLECNANINVEDITISVKDEIDFAGNISGNGKTLTIDTPIFKSTAAVVDPENPPTVTIQCNELAFSQNTEIQSANGAPIQLTVPTISGSGKTVTLSSSGTKLSFVGNVEIEPSIQIEAGTTLTAPSSGAETNPYTMTFKASLDFADGTFKHSNGTVILAPADTIDTVTVGGKSTFYNLTAQGLGGKTIKFAEGNTQTVAGKLTLTGSSTTNKLSLRSTTDGTAWSIKCTASSLTSHDIQYVDVKDANNISNTSEDAATAYKLIAFDSTDSGNNTNWIFDGVEYIWKGGSGSTDAEKTDWNTAANWGVGESLAACSVPASGAIVLIPAGKTYYPVLSADVSLIYDSTYSGSITNNGELTFAGGSLTATTRTNGPGSTIIYDGTTTPCWSDVYENLNIASGTVTFSSDVEIKGNLTSTGNTDGDGYLIFNGTNDQTFAAGTGTYTKIKEDKSNDKTLTVTGSCNITDLLVSAGNIAFANLVTIKTSSFNTTNTVAFQNGANFLYVDNESNTKYCDLVHTAGPTDIKGTLTAADITLNKTNLTGTTKLVAHGNVAFENTTSNGTTTYANVSNNQALTIEVDNGKSVTFNGDVGKTNATKLKSLTITGKTNIKCTKIATTENQIFNGDIILHSNSTSNAVLLEAAEIDFSGNISESGTKSITFTINSPTFKSTAAVADPENPPTVTIQCNELAFSQNTEIQSANGAPIRLTVPTISGNGKTVTLSSSGTKLSFVGNVAIEPSIKTETGTTLTAPSGTDTDKMTFKASLDFADGTFKHSNGTVILAPADTIDTVTVGGKSTFYNLTAQGLGGKTIKFAEGNTQTVAGKLTLTGSSTTNKLSLRSTTDGTAWSIKCTAPSSTSHDIQYVDVKDANNVSEYNSTLYKLFAINSTDSGNNKNWNFPGQEYTWTGAAVAPKNNTAWDEPDNWYEGSVPGIGADVTIGTVTISGATVYPVLTEPLNLNESFGSTNYEGKITVTGIFDLADQQLTVGEIINDGHIKLVGTSNQISGKMKNEDDSTVEYCGGTFVSFAWDGDYGANTTGKQYVNLIINEEITQPDTEVLDVSGLTTIKTSANLNNASNVFANHVKIGNSTSSVNSGTVTLNGTGSGGVAIFLENNILANSLTLNSNVQGDVLTINAPLTINAASILTTGNQIYKGGVTLLKDDITLTAKNSSNAYQTVQFDANVEIPDTGTHKLTVDAKTKINCTSITTNGNQTYNSEVTVSSASKPTISSTGGNLTFADSLKLEQDMDLSADDSTNGGVSFTKTNANVYGNKTLTITAGGKNILFNGTAGTSGNLLGTLHITSSGETKFEKSVYIGTFEDTEDSGNITFKNGGTIQNAVTFNTTGTVSITGTTESPMNIGTTSPYADLKHTAGPSNITGTLNAKVLEFDNLIINGTANINTIGTQTYNGTVNGIENTPNDADDILKLNSNSTLITFNGNVGQSTALKSLEVTGPVEIKCTAITTNGNQTYNGEVTVSSASKPTISSTGGNLTFADDLKLEQDLELSADDSTNGGVSFTNANANVYGNKTLTITAGGKNILFKGTAGTSDNPLGTLHITSSGETKFEKAVYIGTFEDTEDSGNITFKHGGNITNTNGTTFNTPDYITLTGTLITPSIQMNNLIVDGTANINTNGTQTYNGTINGIETTPNDADDILRFNSNSNLITFNGNVGQTKALKTLEVTGPSTIECSTIYTSGAQNFSGAITLSTTNSPHKLSAGSINFDASSTINGAAELELITTSNDGTTFGADVGEDTELASLKVTGYANIDCEKITTTGNQTYNGEVTLIKTGNITLTAKNTSVEPNEYQTVQFNANVGNDNTETQNLIVDAKTKINCASITTNGYQIYKKEVEVISEENPVTISSTGESLTFEDSLKFEQNLNLTASSTNGGVSFTNADANVYGNKTLTITAGEKNILFKGTAGTSGNPLGKLHITSSRETKFEKAVYIGTFEDTEDSGNIIFQNGGTIQNAVTFNTPDEVSITGTMNIGTSPDYANFKHSVTAKNSNTIISGTLNTAALELDNLIINGTANINTNGTQKYNGTINGIITNPESDDVDDILTLSSDSYMITFDGNVGATTALKTLTLNGPVEINCTTIKTTENQTYNGTVTLKKNDDITLTAKNAGNELQTVQFNANVGKSDTGRQNLIIDAKTKINCASITTTGNQTYNGEVTLIKAGNITLTAKNTSAEPNVYQTVQFNANVGNDNTETQNLIVDAKTKIKCDSITVNSATFNQPVELLTNTIITTDSADTSKLIFKKPLSGAYSLETKTGSVTFDDTITNLTLLKTAATATFNGNVNIGVLETQIAKINCETITTTGTQTYNGQVEILSDTTLAAETQINYKSNITDDPAAATRKKLTIDTPIFKSIIATDATANITLGELIFIQNSTSLETENNTFINLNVPKINGVGKTVVIDETIKNISLTPDDVLAEPNITTETNSKLTASSGTTTFNADVDLADDTLAANNGTIILTAANKTTASPAAILKGNNSFNNLVFTNSVTITGSNNIVNLTAGDDTTGLGGKTITFAAGKTQTVSGLLTLMGTAAQDNNMLSLRSSTTGTAWTIKCTGTNNHKIQYVDVQDSNNISNTSPSDDPDFAYNLFALSSYDRGNNVNWNFPNMPYTWIGGNGANNTDWNTKENWSPASVPNKGAVVTIAANKPSYPKLTVPLDLNDTYGTTSQAYNGAITVEAAARFDLADQNLTVGTITNNGLVRLNGSNGQTISGIMINGTDSTVEYYDETGSATITNFAWDGEGNTPQAGKQYEKLHINASVDIAEKITVNNITTITAGTGKFVTLNNASNVFIDKVIIGNDTEAAATSVNAGTVTLNGTGSGGAAIFLENNILADALILNSNVQGAELSINAPLTINTASILTTANQTYKKAVSITSNTKLTAPEGDTILFNDVITGNASLEIVTGSVEFEKSITGLTSLKTAATATFDDEINIGILNTQFAIINCESITAQNAVFEKAVTLLSNTIITTDAGESETLIFKDTLSGNHSLETVTGSVKFDDTITNLTSLKTAAAATFNGDVTAGTIDTQIAKINCESITTSGNQTYNGEVTLIKAGDITLTAKNAANEYQTVQFNANVENASTATQNLIVDANTKINCDSITVNSATFNQPVELLTNTIITTDAADTAKLIFEKPLSGAYSLETKTGSVTFDDTITNLTSLKTAAKATFNGNVTVDTIDTQKADINCAKIKTAENQTYNKQVEILSDTTLEITLGTISFGSSVNGNKKLNFVAGTNNIVFNGTVGTPAAGEQAGNAFHELQLTSAAETLFKDVVNIDTFTDFTESGNVIFKKGGVINTIKQDTFKTTGTVEFGDSGNTSSIENPVMSVGTNLIHTAGNTEIYGKLFVPEKNVTLAATVIAGTIEAEDISLGQTNGTTVVLKGHNITLEEDFAAENSVTITNSGLFKTENGKDFAFGTDTSVDASERTFTQNGTGNSVIGGSFTGNGPAGFATDVQIYGTEAADFGTSGQVITIGTGETAGTQVPTADKNLIIVRQALPAAPLTINAKITKAKNVVLYNGAVILNGDITASQDVLILGQDYSTTDTTTGSVNEYSYYCARPQTWSQPNYNETSLPDGTAVPQDFSATLAVQAGQTVSIAKNFYANGTRLSANGASGQWILKVPDLTNAANAFAEAYHSYISGCKVICSNGSTDGSKARLVALECVDEGTSAVENTNVDFDDFVITTAYTERDNSIRVEFNRPVRYHSESVELLKFHDAVSAPVCDFTGLYSDPDCQNELKYDTELSYFYIKAAPQDSSEFGAWNTDATGKVWGTQTSSAGSISTDRAGIHHETKPCLDFPRALGNTAFVLTDRWGKRLNNYSRRVVKGTNAEAAYGSNQSSDDTFVVDDKTGPVLWKVRTGQELHSAYDTAIGEASEHSYDSHNFIEFRYSEPVNFGETASIAAYDIVENIRVTDTFGKIQNIRQEDNLTIAGLGIIEKGLVYTGSEGSNGKAQDDPYVNALYRKDEYSICLSIAGYTDGTVTDADGHSYKKWVGYIEEAKMPSGTVNHLVDSNNKNELVTDLQGNCQIKYSLSTSGSDIYNTIPVVNSTEDGLYGKWDLSEPVFAVIRSNATQKWDSELFKGVYEAEVIGNNSGVGSTLDRIEFHIFDNTPDFEAGQNEPEWFTETGWCVKNSDGEKSDLYKSYTYAADIFGGARPFDGNTASDNARRTSGGVRFSTISDSAKAFKYGIGTTVPESLVNLEFDTTAPVYAGGASLIFTGLSAPRRSAADCEGLYFALPLKNKTLDITTSFKIKYDDTKGFITDLAGNRLRSKTITTIDRTPPSFDLTVCPVGGDELEIVFVKELRTDSSDLDYINNDSGQEQTITEDFASLITGCFDFIKIDSSGAPSVADDLQVDTRVPAQISIKQNAYGSSFTIIRLKLNREITLDDIKTLHLRVKYHENYGEYSIDKFTNHKNSRVTFIQDAKGNSLQMYTAHALSDFAVEAIKPLYAYDSSMTNDDGSIISDGLYHQNMSDDTGFTDTTSWAVHDWNRDQNNYGTLPADRSIAIVADTSDEEVQNFRLYLTNKPLAAAVSTQYNKDLEPDPKWRIWLPDVMGTVFTALSETNNNNYSFVDGTVLETPQTGKTNPQFIFDISKEMADEWSAGDQVSFLFGLTNSDGTPVTIMHSPVLDINNDMQYLTTSVKMPLYALRLTEPENLLSLDLWSFKLKSNVSQRGGVTILNNAINSSKREKVVIKVNQAEAGNLTVLVMTLDGNIVDYLHRGSSEAGEHFYSWDGTNRRGNAVARGMYFIRVTGPGIDETRKVLVVK